LTTTYEIFKKYVLEYASSNIPDNIIAGWKLAAAQTRVAKEDAKVA
jgi:hypothetical protein